MKNSLLYLFLCIFICISFPIHGQSKFTIDLGISLNATDRKQVNSSSTNQSSIDFAKPKIGLGLHTRAVSNFKRPVNVSLGAELRFSRVKEEIPNSLAYNNTDQSVLFPALIHIKIVDQLKVNWGASFQYLLKRKRRSGDRRADVGFAFLKRTFVIPRVGISLTPFNDIEFNLSYQWGLEQTGSVRFDDLDGNPIWSTDFKDHYLQLTFFQRVLGKVKSELPE